METERWFLVNPPTGPYIREDRCQAPVRGLLATALRAPLDLAYIAGAVTSVGHECRISDCPAEHTTWATFKRELARYRPRYLVVSTTTFTVDADLEACRLAKEMDPSTVTLAKGAVFCADAARLMARHPWLDGALTGDYEMGFREMAARRPWPSILGLVHREGGRVVSNPPRPPVALGDLPAPRRDLIRNQLYRRPDTGRRQTSVLVGRGCGARCIYCIAPLVGGGRARYRPAGDVIDEIDRCVKDYRLREFYFLADTFTWDRAWVLDFCAGLDRAGLRVSWLCNSRVDRIDDELAARMRRAGCWGVSLGIESGVQSILDRIGKGITLDQARSAVDICRRRGLVTLLHFMIGFPWDDWGTVAATVRFARRARGSLTEFNLVTPLPGTPLWSMVREAGLMSMAEDLAAADYSSPTARTFALGPADLARLRRRAFMSLYMDPGFWLRSLRHVNSLNRLARCLAIYAGKLAWILQRRQRRVGGCDA